MTPPPPTKDFLLQSVVDKNSNSNNNSEADFVPEAAPGSSTNFPQNVLSAAERDDVLLNNLTSMSEEKSDSAKRINRLIPDEAKAFNDVVKPELSRVFEELERKRNPIQV